MKRRTQLLFFVVLFQGVIVFSQVNKFSIRTIQSDTTWSSDTIRIFNNITIENSATLSVLEGVYVEFQDHYFIEVKGVLNAYGNKYDSITFTIKDTTGFSDTATIVGGWGGIRYMRSESNDTSFLNYCNFSYGKAVKPGDVGYYKNENNGGCLSAIEYPNIVISNSSFINNRANNFGGATHFIECDNVEIKECSFMNNFTYKRGGGIYIENAEYFIIRNNLFYKNTAYEVLDINGETGAGSGVHVSQRPGNGNGCIESNRFFNNKSVNGAIYESCFRIRVINNIIANNYGVGLGEGITMTFNALFANNTIVNNWGWIVPALWFNAHQTKMVNNIIWGNESAPSFGHQIYSSQGGITANISYSCIQDGYDGEGNTSKYPDFVNPTAGSGLEFDALNANWLLLDSSPCINMGTTDTTGYNLPLFDILGNQRVYGYRIDMGALENQNIVSLPEDKLISSRIKIAPNPFKEKLSVYLNNKIQINRIKVYNQSGIIVKEIENIISSDQYIIDLSRFQSGMYFLHLEYKDGSLGVEKIIKL